jgi:hypothetical protein
MIRLLLFFTALLLAPLHALPWENHTYGCAAILPENGWQPIQTPDTPGVASLIVIQNPSRAAVFGVTVLTGAPNANLRDPVTTKFIEDMLRGFGYELFGSSTTPIAGIEWKQYSVRSSAGGQVASGVVRFTSRDGRIFGMTLLLGGGKEAAQDQELQAIGRSFRFFPVTAAPPPPPAAPPVASAPPVPKSEPKPEAPATAPAKPSDTADKPDYVQLAIIGAGAIVVILIILKLIGGGGGGGSIKPGPRPPQRR